MPFWFMLIAILTIGPGINEGGFKAVQDKGVVEAVETAIDEREGVPITQDVYKERFND